jgi:phosphatidate phosphatase APP1
MDMSGVAAWLRTRARAACTLAVLLLAPFGCAAGNSEDTTAAAIAPEIIVYPAFARVSSPKVIEGRVVKHEERTAIRSDDGSGRNLKRQLKLLVNHEIADLPVRVFLGSQQGDSTTDAEGYFRLTIPAAHSLDAGWQTATVEAGGGRGAGRVLLVADGVTEAVISDVDDTLLITGVSRKRSLLKNSLLRNYMRRKAVPRMPELLRHLAREPSAAVCCVFYLSSTPRQLHSSLEGFLEYNEFPHGILMTKRVTGDASGESLRDHHDYKLDRLEDIFTRLPHLRFTLLGDDAEADPEIYAEIARRYPGRVNAIWIRETRNAKRSKKLEGQGSVADLIARTLD